MTLHNRRWQFDILPIRPEMEELEETFFGGYSEDMDFFWLYWMHKEQRDWFEDSLAVGGVIYTNLMY